MRNSYLALLAFVLICSCKPEEKAQMFDEETFGVVNVSVADMRTQPDYSAEMATQLLLGAPVKAIQHQGWIQVESAENYAAWMPANSFVIMNKAEFNAWTAAPKIIFTDTYGFAYEQPDETKSRFADLVFGNMLKFIADEGRFYKAEYPDGRQAFVLKSQSQGFEDWKHSVSPTEESIIDKALSLKGIPYTWGGTSTKMMDCSGFSKTVFLMNGIILMRDASQQAATGIPVDIGNGYGNLRAGDLLFFGRKGENGAKDRVRHVGIYMGNLEFIHEAGNVHISSFDSSKPNYDERNTQEFISATRIIGAVGTAGIWEIGKNPLYNEQK
jgi:cell wall-associated NlpC family hydrolase